MRDRTVIGGLVLLALVMRGRSSSVPWGAGWWWPVPNVRRPDGNISGAYVSQEYKGNPHAGVDIINRGGSPAGVPITAARGGHVWSVKQTSRGWGVVIDHGKPFATFYQHLESVSALAAGMQVQPGQRLGTMGIDPQDPQRVRHLHFAVWFEGFGDTASIDPMPVIGNWQRPPTWSTT